MSKADSQPRMAEKLKNATPVEKQARDLDYQTPENILECVRAYFAGPIPLDPATAANNPTQAIRYYTPNDDGLLWDWLPFGVFVNPPYGSEMRNWLGKIAHEAKSGTEILALLPVNRFEQGYLHDVLAFTNAICWIRKRVSFIRPSTGEKAKGNPYASMLLGLNCNRGRFSLAFSSLGYCWRTEELVLL
jgi:phage N-6-adenine-methyltransferase